MNSRSASLAALSGILLALSFPGFDVSAFAWIALVPLLLALKDTGLKSGFVAGAITGFVYFLGTIYWITNSLHVYGRVPLLPAAFMTLLLCAVLAVYPAVFGAAVARIGGSRPFLVLIAAPALWTALELARSRLFTGFPWALIGYSQYRVLPLIQIADITGVYGVSFLVVLVNAAVFLFAANRKDLRPLAAAGIIVVLAAAYGYGKLRTPERTDGLRISIIQGNIEQHKKWDPAYQTEAFSAYKRLTLQALQARPGLVIWPETSTPFYFNGTGDNDRALADELVAFVREHRVPLLFGSPAYERTPDRRVIAWNSAYLLAADGGKAAEYRKMHLVPFGEYVPMKKALFFMDKLVQTSGDFEAGNRHTVMAVPAEEGAKPKETLLSVVICYEIIFPDLVRAFVDRGATIIATITNDAWFGRTSAPFQHFSMAVFRAVENRVPVARAANTGVSGFIDARGRILSTTEIFTEARIAGTLSPGTERTFYTRRGDLFAHVCALAGLLMLPWRRPTSGTPMP